MTRKLSTRHTENLSRQVDNCLYWYRESPSEFPERIESLCRSLTDINNTIERLQNEQDR